MGGGGQLGRLAICVCITILLTNGRKVRTMRNLNIKSDQAYDLATFIAKRTGKSLTLVVTEALQKEKRFLTKDELIEKWTKIAEDNWERMTPEQREWDYNADMYDEWGLPK
jgi:hypothetical protein